MKSLAVADRYGWTRFVAHQVHYSLIGREYEWELMPLALDQNVGALVWSPLGWGRLTGKLRRGQPRPAVSRLHKTVGAAPPVSDERLYRHCRCPRRSRRRDRQNGSSGGLELAAAAAHGLLARFSARATRSSCGRTWGP